MAGEMARERLLWGSLEGSERRIVPGHKRAVRARAQACVELGRSARAQHSEGGQHMRGFAGGQELAVPV